MEEEIKEQSVRTEENKGALADDVLNKVSGGIIVPVFHPAPEDTSGPKDPKRAARPKGTDNNPAPPRPKSMPHVFKP